MNKLYYPAIFHREKVGYSVVVPDLDGCFSQGDTIEEAIAMTVEAIDLYLDGVREKPRPGQYPVIKVGPNDVIFKILYKWE